MLSGHHWTVNFNYSWSFDNYIYILLWKYTLISRFFQNVNIYNRKEHTTVGIVLTRALRPSSIFCAALTFTPSEPSTLNKVQYPADIDVLKVICFHNLTTRVPKS